MPIRRKVSSANGVAPKRLSISTGKRMNRAPLSIKVSGSCSKSEAEALVETIRATQSVTVSQERERAVAQKVRLMKATAIGRALLDLARSDEVAAQALRQLLPLLPEDKRALFSDEITTFVDRQS